MAKLYILRYVLEYIFQYINEYFKIYITSVVIVRITKFTLCEKCQNTVFFWSVFSCIQTEYRKIRLKKTPYLESLCNLVIRLSHRPLSGWKGGQAIDFLLREQYIYCHCPEIKFPVDEFFGTCERIRRNLQICYTY